MNIGSIPISCEILHFHIAAGTRTCVAIKVNLLLKLLISFHQQISHNVETRGK